MRTTTGFEFKVDKNALDNMELLDAFSAIMEDENDITGLTKCITLLLGKAQKRRLYDHVRTEDGRVPVEAISREIADIFHALGDDAKK